MRDEQATEFRSLLAYATTGEAKYAKGWSLGCFGETQVLQALRAATTDVEFTYVDVGANKGESMSTVLELWGDLGVKFVMEQADGGPACGVVDVTPSIYAIEPGPGNLELLHTLRSKMPQKIAQSMHIEQMAMSASGSGWACMQGDESKGNEVAAIDRSADAAA